MRYEKVDSHLQLVLEMRARRYGISLGEIEQKFRVGRRTAMRMRDAVQRNFPQLEEMVGSDRIKRWRIPDGVINRLVSFSAEELADLKTTIKYLKGNNLRTQAKSLEEIASKLQAMMEPSAARKVEPDLEALMEAEGIAMRPGPRPRADSVVVNQLREAIKACRQVVLQYRNRSTKRLGLRQVHPYGFILGHRNYLVAFNANPRKNKIVLFSLPNIEDVEILKEPFTRDPEFSLQAYAEQSFEIYQEEPFDVVWRFLPEALENAREFLFHPSQEAEEQSDGSLIVRFRAGGLLEMAWHLYKWGDKVEVLEPKNLAEIVRKDRRSWEGMP